MWEPSLAANVPAKEDCHAVRRRFIVLGWALFLLTVSLASAVLAFGSFAAAVAATAQVVFWLSLAAFIVVLGVAMAPPGTPRLNTTRMTDRLPTAPEAPATRSGDLARRDDRSDPAADFTTIVGVGNVINDVLHGAGFRTYEELASASADDISAILERAGLNTQLHDPSDWPAQARAEMREPIAQGHR